MWVKKQQLAPCMEQRISSGWRKKYDKAVCCHPVYLTYTQSTSCEMLGWIGYKLESRLLESISLRSVGDITLMAESKKELKSLLMRVKREGEKANLKLNIKESKIMASSPLTSWQTEGENVGTVMDFLFLDSKITADHDCCYEISRQFLLGRKAMAHLDSVLKSRDITLPTKVCIHKAIFPVVMYRCKSWTIKKAEL